MEKDTVNSTSRKQEYAAPKLRVYGDLATLTQQLGHKGPDSEPKSPALTHTV